MLMKSFIIIVISLPTLLASCSTGYFQHSTNCLRCYDYISLCQTCNYPTCTKCVSGYGLNLGTCKRCKDYITGCTSCFSIGTCDSCQSRYELIGNSCVRCVDNNCLNCSTSISVCTKCTNKYGVDLTNNSCVSCLQSNCSICGENYEICTMCKNGLGVEFVNISCIPCQQQNCIYCWYDYQQCKGCSVGYWLKLTMTCEICPSSCKACYNNVSCYQCFDGYGFDKDYGMCRKCHNDCQLCHYRYFTCTRCKDGFYLKNGTCIKCPKFNLKCKYEAPNIVCLQPQAGHGMYFAGFSRCGQRCGDSITESYDCDNQLGIPYDGCDDNCHQMDNFTCVVTNGTTLCQYDGNIIFNFVSFKKDPLKNSFTLIVEIVEPILYSFLSLTQEEAFEMFTISHPQIKITSLKYDNVKNTITFFADFYNDLVDLSTIDITFHQSFVYDQIFQIPFSYDNSNKPILITETDYFYCKILEYGCYFVVFFGWISFVLGIFLRRLYGIEVMMMLQLCWISLMWNETREFLFIFSRSSVLKLLSGFNMVIFEDSKIVELVNYQYFEMFEMLNKLFINNFNVSICFVILPCVVALVFYAKFRIGLRRSSTLNSVDDKNLMRNERYLIGSCEIVMQGCMIVFPYFCECLFLFLKYGEILNISSILIITVCGALIICTIINFLWNPTLFEYFGISSFVVKRLALNYWLIHISMIVVTILIITILPAITYIALIPSLFMLIFILVYRPYSQSKHNISSCLNYFAILCFLILRVGQVYLPKQTRQDREIFSLYLLFSVCGLLPLTIFINNGIMLYDYFMKTFMCQIQKIIKVETKQMMEERKLIEEISIVNVKKKLKSCNVSILKNMLPRDENVLDCSNAIVYEMRLEQRQTGRSESLIKRSGDMKRQGDGQIIDKRKKYELIKQKIKRQMLKKKRGIKQNEQKQRYYQVEWNLLDFQQREIKIQTKDQQQIQQIMYQQKVENDNNNSYNNSHNNSYNNSHNNSHNSNDNNNNLKILKQQNKYINLKGAIQKGQKQNNQQNNQFIKIYQNI